MEERVRDARHVVFWRVARRDQGLQVLDQQRNSLWSRKGREQKQVGSGPTERRVYAGSTDLPELVPARLISRAHLNDECDSTEEDPVVAVLDERLCL